VGGRNQELALSFAVNMPSMRGVSLVSFATDGVDGPTPAAGALVDEQALEMAKGMALNPEHYLVNNDSHTFFSKVQTTIETGPTGSNLGDLVAILLEA
jgi:glycerate-2-kinase